MNLTDERITILRGAVEHRAREVMHHQINIDNYVRAIDLIDARHADDMPMQAFRAQLVSLLESSRVEQRKEQLLLDVIRQQLDEADKCTP
jgi:hypothetical protein